MDDTIGFLSTWVTQTGFQLHVYCTCLLFRWHLYLTFTHWVGQYYLGVNDHTQGWAESLCRTWNPTGRDRIPWVWSFWMDRPPLAWKDPLSLTPLNGEDPLVMKGSPGYDWPSGMDKVSCMWVTTWIFSYWKDHLHWEDPCEWSPGMDRIPGNWKDHLNREDPCEWPSGFRRMRWMWVTLWNEKTPKTRPILIYIKQAQPQLSTSPCMN